MSDHRSTASDRAAVNLASLNAPGLTPDALAAWTFHPLADVRAIARAEIRRRHDRAAQLRADANELDTYAETAEAFAAREDRAANAFGYGSERAANARRDARRAREEAAAARERADALDPNDPDQGNCPDGHPCRLTPDATRRECLTCGYIGQPLTASSADEPENLDPAECCGAEPGAPCRPWCVNLDTDPGRFRPFDLRARKSHGL